jgi:hypothetical protein
MTINLDSRSQVALAEATAASAFRLLRHPTTQRSRTFW